MAAISLIYAGGVVFAVSINKLDKAQDRTKTMWYGTIFTLLSGILLSFMTKSSITGTCVTLLSFLGVVGAAHYYQRNVRKKTGCPYLDQL